MVTRFHNGTTRPTQRLNLHVSSVLPLPKSYRDTFNDLNWQNDMCDEYNALIKNNTWNLVPRPMNTNIVRCIWLFRHKYLDDGSLSRYKARRVANGSTQLEGIDVDETFSPVVKPDLGSLNYFLGISVTHSASDMFLSQRKYATEILERAGMVTCNSSRNPVDTESKLGDDGDRVSDPMLYRSLTGSLKYPTFTRPDISYAVQQVCLYMHDPREPYFSALKRILRYVCGTLGYGLQLFSSSTTNLVAYLDADWAGCPTTQRSTLVSSKHQPTLSHSKEEAEYHRVANAIAETCWLWNLLRELHTSLSSATLVYYDNVRVLHVPSRYQYADIFTKGLPSALFEEFRTSLSIRCPPALTAGEC
ncbi:ribonuclease H-like domain-containing protein [Tanacetum coccineum]|uniref:Ribonuclease H-like domain-containing protein n=1 Tax=Tanacetum coccineum TaxID=301880 RepID=A0ABQ5I0I2_9ASTR